MKIAVDSIVDLGRVDEDRGTIEPDKKIGMEKWVVRDIRAAKVESIRCSSSSESQSRIRVN